MLEQKYIPELNRKLITLKRNLYAYVFAPDMQSGSTVACAAGDTFMLDGTVYASDGVILWVQLRTDKGNNIVCLSAGDVENIGMDDTGGSLGSFLGRLNLPFTLPVSPNGVNKFNAFLKKLLLFGAGALILSNLLKNKDNE